MLSRRANAPAARQVYDHGGVFLAVGGVGRLHHRPGIGAAIAVEPRRGGRHRLPGRRHGGPGPGLLAIDGEAEGRRGAEGPVGRDGQGHGDWRHEGTCATRSFVRSSRFMCPGDATRLPRVASHTAAPAWWRRRVGRKRGFARSGAVPTRRAAARAQMAPVRPTATNAESYYAYEGSFTAPPCAEGVAWRVLKNPLPVAAADLLAFRRVQGSNNRPPQPLDGRPVLDSSPAPAGP